MRTINLTLKEMAQLVNLQKTKKWKWPAVFSTNPHESVWAGTTYGLTPIEEREELSDLVPVLNRIRDLYLGQREKGGRMFIDFDGAFYKDEQNQQFQIVRFNIDFRLDSSGKK